MKRITRLQTVLLSLFLAAAAWADVPFKVTTITDGKFAIDTYWYTMSIGNGKYLISDNGTADHIALNRPLSPATFLEDSDLWCFVGNETTGYRIYNKKTGTAKVLAAPATVSGNGSTTYVVMKNAAALGGYKDTWDITPSTDLPGMSGYYLLPHGTANAVNNFGGNGKLAFWTGGKDQGSTVVFGITEGNYQIAASTGALAGSGTFSNMWTSAQDNPRLTLDCEANNMKFDGDNVACFTGTSQNAAYRLSVPAGYYIKGYSFDFVNTGDNSGNKNYELTLTCGNQTFKTSGTKQSVNVEGLDKATVSFTLSGSNQGISLSNFYVDVCRSNEEPEPQFEIFTTKPGDVVNRIPAIAKAHNGDLIAVADYRYSGADIGMSSGADGKLDLRFRTSSDNGVTWSGIRTLAAAKGYAYGNATGDSLNAAFGDPCIVADRESGRVLVLSCSGMVSFPNGTRTNHQGIARFYSEDNGQTWSAATDISDPIYTMFDKRKDGSIRCMFIGSGKISQSSTVKVGDYYRLYCAALVKLGNGANVNFVFYSDDFGGTWDVLGGVDVSPIPSGGDEPKADELPDGSVIISSRTMGGRLFNIFSFTNTEKAEGSWGTMAFSGASNNGTTALSNSCNGEIMIVPVTRNADNRKMYLMLQSVPLGAGRSNVGIYYKELESLSDFISPDSIAKDWDGSHQASFMGSAYSTMTLQKDNTVGFLYEESTYGRDYTIVYKNYSIEYITDTAYSYNAEVDRNTIFEETSAIQTKVDELCKCTGTNVGNLTENGAAGIRAAFERYKANPCQTAYETLNAAIAAAESVEIEAGRNYRLRNSERQSGKLYIKVKPGAAGLIAATRNPVDKDQLFHFIPTEEGWKIFSDKQQVYICRTGVVESPIPVSKNIAQAAPYEVRSTRDGLSALVCLNPESGYPAIHLSGDNTRLVPWNAAGSPASLWYIEPTDILTDIAYVRPAEQEDATIYYNLDGRRVENPDKGVFVTNKRRKVILK